MKCKQIEKQIFFTLII